MTVIRLRCECNNYPWGKKGRDSLAAQLCSKTPGFKIEDKNYAEMWMGTYPVTPSYVLATGEKLQDVLDKNKDLIGENVLKKFGSDLPFLPKILSIAAALPLQIHPDIELSKKLHEKEPDKFQDTNHKPEIAVALSKFEAFCGFKTKEDINELLKIVPQFEGELRESCRKMLLASEEEVASTLEKLEKADLGKHKYIKNLIPRLVGQYGKTDNGSLVALLLMNYMVFEPGEAIWIPADGIHAYLYGDIVECMARSDNVLNTGFCPRADRDDVDLFCSALTFEQHDPKKPILGRSECEFSKNGKTFAFKPPMSEFNMMVTELESGEEEVLEGVNGPSILWVTKGKGQMETENIDTGYIYFIGQGMVLQFNAGIDGLTVYRAYAE